MSLELILGPMFAGKSSTLLQRIGRAHSLGWKTCILTSNLDTRYDSFGTSIYTHTGERLSAVGVKTLTEALDLDEYAQAKVVFIDEAQFFPDLYTVVMRMVEEDGRHVTVVGLDGDWKREPIGQMLQLIPKADSYTKLTALCKLCGDGTSAVFSMKTVTDDQQIAVGGANTYKAVCRKHFLTAQ